MKLLITVVHNRDKNALSSALLSAGYRFTEVASTGGLLREGNTTFLIGVEEEELQNVLSIVEKNCKTREQFITSRPLTISDPSAWTLPIPVKIQVGGAVVFVIDVESFHRF